MMLDADIRLHQGAFELAAAFRAPPGITALFGPSGSGKSTILAALAGLRRMQGHVRLDGRELGGLKPHRRGIGLVFQDARLFPISKRARQHRLCLGARAASCGAGGWRDIARFFDITAQLDRPVGNLSGGEKKPRGAGARRRRRAGFPAA